MRTFNRGKAPRRQSAVDGLHTHEVVNSNLQKFTNGR